MYVCVCGMLLYVYKVCVCVYMFMGCTHAYGCEGQRLTDCLPRVF